MNNLLSYCGLVDGKIRTSDKDLPVPTIFQGLTRIRYFSFLLRDIRAFSETKVKNDMFRLPTELEYVLCWPCNMDVYLTCHFLT